MADQFSLSTEMSYCDSCLFPKQKFPLKHCGQIFKIYSADKNAEKGHCRLFENEE